jgi:hypothetical protein
MTYDVRSALAALAAEAPVELRRSEQVWERYRRHRRRKVGLAVGTAIAAVAVLASLVAPHPGQNGLVTHQPSPTVTSRSSGLGVSAPRRAGTPAPAPAPGVLPASGTSTASAPFVSPTVSGSGGPPVAVWPAGVVAWASPTHLHAGDVTTVSVYPYAGDNGVDGYTIDWGDGTAPIARELRYCQSTQPDGRHQLQGHAWLSTHGFAANGEYRITVTVRFGHCRRPRQIRTTTTMVRVDDASTGIRPEGMAGTSVLIDRVDPAEPAPRKVALSISEQNADSYASFVFVSWGDGTADVLRDGVPPWCATSPPALDPDFPRHVEHTYAHAGHYDVFVTAQTATCEGGGGRAGVNQESLDI